ncbi:MAG: RpiB/LacA/LacB family sugar-phosphate isomerase [Actinomycetota bacterium]
MKIAIGADHAGFEVKEKIKRQLAEMNFEVEDLGTNSLDSVDYPDYGAAVGRWVASGKADEGILVCGSGIVSAIAANKFCKKLNI